MRIIVTLILILLTNIMYAQKGKTYFGIQLKPIIPNRYIGQFEQTFSYDTVPFYNGVIKQKTGLVLGMSIRHGISESISIESGINLTRRHYDITYTAEDSAISTGNDLTIISYEIPVNALVYIKLSETWYMNASGGLNFSFFPSDVYTEAENNTVNSLFYQVGIRKSWIKLGFNANYGFEYRTKKSGIFYTGLSYNYPFGEIMAFRMTWRNNGIRYQTNENISGSYLTLDLKYFFNS